MRASASNPPSTCERGAWLEPDQGLAGSKCVRRTGHGLNGKAATTHVGKRVAAEEHQVGVAPVDPERYLSFVIRISELKASEAILVSLKVGEGMVECCQADRPRFPKSYSVSPRLSCRSEDLVRRIARQFAQIAQNQSIDSCCSERLGTDERSFRRTRISA
jgi:hypothetical protein